MFMSWLSYWEVELVTAVWDYVLTFVTGLLQHRIFTIRLLLSVFHMLNMFLRLLANKLDSKYKCKQGKRQTEEALNKWSSLPKICFILLSIFHFFGSWLSSIRYIVTTLSFTVTVKPHGYFGGKSISRPCLGQSERYFTQKHDVFLTQLSVLCLNLTKV